MITINTEIYSKRKKELVIPREIRLREHENKSPVVQVVTETRTRRDNDSEYSNVHSREIKKWFESRRF